MNLQEVRKLKIESRFIGVIGEFDQTYQGSYVIDIRKINWSLLYYFGDFIIKIVIDVYYSRPWFMGS